MVGCTTGSPGLTTSSWAGILTSPLIGTLMHVGSVFGQKHSFSESGSLTGGLVSSSCLVDCIAGSNTGYLDDISALSMYLEFMQQRFIILIASSNVASGLLVTSSFLDMGTFPASLDALVLSCTSWNYPDT